MATQNSAVDSLPKIIRNIPSDCLGGELGTSLLYLLRDVAMTALGFWLVLAVDSWWLGIPAAIFLGLSLSGFFVIGHDCGHRSFARSRWVNDLVGHLVTSPLLWPFHVWRLDHDAHHRYSSHVDKDTAWRPITYRLWLRMPRWNRLVYLWTRKLFFLGSFYTTYTNVKEGFRAGTSDKFNAEEKAQIRLSMAMMVLMGGAYLLASIYLAGFYGFVCLFLIPQIIFQSLLSTYTFFHHTAPGNLFMDKRHWRPEVAQLCHTIHVKYPRFLEFFNHDINWHIPHHVCVGIPHYKLRKAHAALKEKYPEAIREEELSWDYIKEVTGQCQFITSKLSSDMDWISYEDARAKEDARQQKVLARKQATAAAGSGK